MRRESGAMARYLKRMTLFEEEQKLRAVFTTDPEAEAQTAEDPSARYLRRSKIARWGVRFTLIALLSMISTVLLSEPRIKALIDEGIAVWKTELQARLPDSITGGSTDGNSGANGEGARPPVSILPGSVVPVRRAGG